MKHTIEITGPTGWMKAIRTDTLVLDKILHWNEADGAEKMELLGAGAGPITVIYLATGHARVPVYSLEKAEDFGRRYEEAMQPEPEAIAVHNPGEIPPGWDTDLGLLAAMRDPEKKKPEHWAHWNDEQRERKPELPRYLIVNIDKHQGDVTATAELSENVLRDCAATMTLIIDTREQRARLGSSVVPLGRSPRKQTAPLRAHPEAEGFHAIDCAYVWRGVPCDCSAEELLAARDAAQGGKAE
jgi:hypothetical protein